MWRAPLRNAKGLNSNVEGKAGVETLAVFLLCVLTANGSNATAEESSGGARRTDRQTDRLWGDLRLEERMAGEPKCQPKQNTFSIYSVLKPYIARPCIAPGE